MTWVGACLVAVFLIGALLGSVFSRQREDAERDQSHADKLDYPSDTNQETSIATLARSHIAFAKDANAADKRQSSYNKRSHRISFWTAIGIVAYTVLTAAIVVFSIVQYGEIHRFNKKQRNFFADQIEIMRGQLNEMRNEQRPWLRQHLTFVSPFMIDNIANTANVAAQFSIDNIGHSPAVYVNIFTELNIYCGALLLSNPKPVTDQQAFCEPVLHGGQVAGRVGFPGTIVFPGPIIFPNDAAVIESFPLQSENIVHEPGKPESIWPFIIGCIDYSFAGSDEHHQTGFVYMMYRLDQAHPGAKFGFDTSVSTVPAQNLSVELIFNGGVRIN